MSHVCYGTVNAGKCRSVANHSFCFSNDGLVEYQGRCVEGSFEFVSTKKVSYISTLYLKYFLIILITLIFFTRLKKTIFFFFFTVFFNTDVDQMNLSKK